MYFLWPTQSKTDDFCEGLLIAQVDAFLFRWHFFPCLVLYLFGLPAHRHSLEKNGGWRDLGMIIRPMKKMSFIFKIEMPINFRLGLRTSIFGGDPGCAEHPTSGHNIWFYKHF